MEAELAQWVIENDCRMPIVAFMAGRFMDEMPGMSFGHAGTIVEGKEDTAAEKIARLADAGITVAEEISEIPRHHEVQAAAAVEHVKLPSVSVPSWVRGGGSVEDRRHLHRHRGRRRGADERAGPCRASRTGLPRRHLPRAGDGVLEIVAHNVDECVLCRLCLDIAHLDVVDGAVRVLKLYDGGADARVEARSAVAARAARPPPRPRRRPRGRSRELDELEQAQDRAPPARPICAASARAPASVRSSSCRRCSPALSRYSTPARSRTRPRSPVR